MIHKAKKLHRPLLHSFLICTTFFYMATSASAQTPDQDALAVLKNSTDFLAAQQQFSVSSEVVVEAVLESGQRIQFDNAATLAVKKPNKLKAERVGDLVDQQMLYNGKTFTLFNPSVGMYATEAMPATLDAMLDKVRDDFDIISPASDLMYSDAYTRLTSSATSGFIVGKAMIDGTVCTQLAFRSPGIDWQIWIADGAKPLPHKMVLTSTDVVGSPQFEVRLKKWNLAPNLADSVFEFKAPAGSQQIQFISPSK